MHWFAKKLRDNKPLCSVCGKRVDAIRFERGAHGYDYDVTVSCHGALVRLSVDEKWLEANRWSPVAFGDVFGVPQLPTAVKGVTRDG